MVGPVRWKEMVFSSCMMYMSTSIECADGHQRKQHENKYYWKSRLASPLCCCVMRPPAVWNNNRIFFLVKKGHNMVYADARRLSTMSSLNPNQHILDDSTVIMMLRGIFCPRNKMLPLFFCSQNNAQLNGEWSGTTNLYGLPIANWMQLCTMVILSYSTSSACPQNEVIHPFPYKHSITK